MDCSIFFLLLMSMSAAGDSPVICSSEGVVCEFCEDNLIDSVMHVKTVEDCTQMCLNDQSCEFITYFDDSATPISHFCQLFKSCETVNNCSSCISENMACNRTCSKNLVGDLDENVLDVIPNIKSEIDCKQSCLAHPNCTFYTYFFPNDTIHHQYCFLQTELVGPQQPCETCITGPADCSNTGGCSLSMNGEKHKALMLTSVGQTSEIEVINDWGNVTCSVALLVVGGGGKALYSGGGSGYLVYRSVHVAAGTRLTGQVGDSGHSSNVISPDSSELNVTAQAGESSYLYGSDGGAGYSGGGGGGQVSTLSPAGDGGSNGGGGKDGFNSGGAGTGEDVSVYLFSAWTLGPGAGGKHTTIHGGNYYAGGGGGVLVDGEGPPGGCKGAGYGGGGGDAASGHPGVILIETN